MYREVEREREFSTSKCYKNKSFQIICFNGMTKECILYFGNRQRNTHIYINKNELHYNITLHTRSAQIIINARNAHAS